MIRSFDAKLKLTRIINAREYKSFISSTDDNHFLYRSNSGPGIQPTNTFRVTIENPLIVTKKDFESPKKSCYLWPTRRFWKFRPFLVASN